MEQIGWVIDHLDDIASDLSVFHRIDDMYAMDGPQFFSKVWRLVAYQGVMKMRYEMEFTEEQQPSAPQPVAPLTRNTASDRPVVGKLKDGDKVVPLAQMMDLVERKRV
ncbi:hypothetical protein ACFQH9_02150 [Pseudonocardia lutea]|uniref:Uncharacterized protein n=1 Tax=Pseudonocardia lutea TaxID=2172015 RepID=A0ABW1I2W4_9PSEU